MAKGDVIVQMSGSNTVLTYQPASGIETVVTHIAATVGSAGAVLASLTDGTGTAAIGAFPQQNIAAAPATVSRLAVFINNSVYLKIDAAGLAAYSSFSGVQVK